VVLLGLYNGQKLEQQPAADMVLYSRATGPAAAAVEQAAAEGRAEAGVAQPEPQPAAGGALPAAAQVTGAAGGAAPSTFVRVLLLRGRMQGAVLLGDTDLEEVCENLVLDGLDLSAYGAALLDPDVELDHMFD
jgi:pyridine nucleotide-disulfide oxidoreductase domain-containing protein 1